MNLKFLIVSLPLLLLACGECKPDKYGEILELVVPVTTSPAKDTFAIGDTLLVEANFSKDIEIYNTAYSIELDSFRFFGLFGISEISDTVENYYADIDTIVEVGQVGYLPLHGALAYPVTFLEDEVGYRLKFRIVLKTPGRFWIGLSSASYFYDRPNYDHPALYVCNKNRRDRVEVFYINPSTTPEAYKDIFLKTKVEYLHQLMNYDRYLKGASISIIVQ